MESSTNKQSEALVKPPKDTRVKTDDVASIKGLTFQSFGLSQDVLLVSANSTHLVSGRLRNGL